MGALKYFLDTYAIIEIQKGNPSYKKISEEQGVTSVFNLAETYCILLGNSQVLAEKTFEVLSKRLVEIPLDNVKKAMRFRKEFNEKNKAKLSYADAIAYTYATENNLTFVTGDDAFKHLYKVLFIK